jgi:hypothetical protein
MIGAAQTVRVGTTPLAMSTPPRSRIFRFQASMHSCVRNSTEAFFRVISPVAGSISALKPSQWS